MKIDRSGTVYPYAEKNRPSERFTLVSRGEGNVGIVLFAACGKEGVSEEGIFASAFLFISSEVSSSVFFACLSALHPIYF